MRRGGAPEVVSKPCVLGDTNCDTELTPGDALRAFHFYLGRDEPLPEEICDALCGADLNEDGRITPSDALCIFKAYLGNPC